MAGVSHALLSNARPRPPSVARGGGSKAQRPDHRPQNPCVHSAGKPNTFWEYLGIWLDSGGQYLGFPQSDGASFPRRRVAERAGSRFGIGAALGTGELQAATPTGRLRALQRVLRGRR
jgi:hypothetical protein